VAAEHIDHPDWQHAHRKLVELFEQEMFAERAAGRLTVSLTADEIRQMARWKATKSIETTIRLYESPEAVAARKRKTFHAA
jgi:hypothetical protein